MALILFGMSFQRYAQGRSVATIDYSRSDDLRSALPEMTEIFRLAFQASFSDAQRAPLTGKQLARGSARLDLIDCQILHSGAAKLDGTEGVDYLLVCALSVDCEEDPADFWRGEFRTLESKLALLREFELTEVVDGLSVLPDRLVGQNSYVMRSGDIAYRPSLLSVFAFYLYGWILSLRAERNQLTASLSISFRRSGSRARDIALQRLRVINLSRYFLTDDRSNDPVTKELCDSLRLKFKLDARYERLASLHKDFEHHLDNTSKIAQSEQLGSVSNLIAILTVLSIPISFFSAIVAVNLQSPVFTSASGVLLDYRVYLLFAIGILVALAPFAVLRVVDIARRKNDG